jgi:proline iminopeptidase
MTPDAHTNQELFIEVGDGHELYIQDWGNKQAKTVFFNIHGGPGSATKDSHKRQYDPARQRVIFFDQRGTGRSLPYGSLEHNTTQDLVEDITKIADKLGIEQFVLRGNSWGSTLALAYALKYPKRAKALVLAGIFTGSRAETEWLFRGVFKSFYPEAWQAFLDKTPKSHHKDPSAYHLERALGSNAQATKESCYAYGCLEGAVLRLDDRFVPDDFETYDPASEKTELHYLKHLCFMPDNYILDNAHKLTMPVYVVQGRYDMVCPPVTAYELCKRLPQGELTWALSGHLTDHESWNLVRTIMLELSK